MPLREYAKNIQLGVKKVMKVLLHGRNFEKIQQQEQTLAQHRQAIADLQAASAENGQALEQLQQALHQAQQTSNQMQQALGQAQQALAQLQAETNELKQAQTTIEQLGQRQDQLEKATQENGLALYLQRWARFWKVYSHWWSWGGKDLLAPYKEQERFDTFWQINMPGYWLIYICCLLEANEKEHAKDVLVKYIALNGTTEIAVYLPVASFMVDIPELAESVTEKIRTGASVYKTLNLRKSNALLDDALKKAKTVAIVGNSNRELGKNLGAEIDSHDIVIRFNEYHAGKPLADYGEKTTVWCRNGAIDCPDYAGKYGTQDRYSYVVWMDDYSHTYVQGNLLELFDRDLKSPHYKALTIPSEVHSTLRRACNLANPTSGAYMIWYVRTLLGTLKNVDFYGFSFLDGGYSSSDCDGEVLLSWHEMTTETAFFYELLKQDKNRENPTT